MQINRGELMAKQHGTFPLSLYSTSNGVEVVDIEATPAQSHFASEKHTHFDSTFIAHQNIVSLLVCLLLDFHLVIQSERLKGGGVGDERGKRVGGGWGSDLEQ